MGSAQNIPEEIAKSVNLFHASYSGRNTQRRIISRLIDVLTQDAVVLDKTLQFVGHHLFELSDLGVYEVSQKLRNENHYTCFTHFFSRWVSLKSTGAKVGVILDVLEDLNWNQCRRSIIDVGWENIPGIHFE